MTFPRMATIVPEGECGQAEVSHFTVGDEDARFHNLRTAFIQNTGGPIKTGTFCRLSVNGSLLMTDTPAEARSNYEVVRRSHGHVFIAGLGLGMILHPILEKEEVESVTVIEVYQDVINLVAPTLTGGKLTIICANAYEWKPPKSQKFNVIYFDIWGDTSTDDLVDMARLHQRAKFWLDRSDDDRWMSSWRRDELKHRKRQEARQYGGWC